jgi:hypothetical protein
VQSSADGRAFRPPPPNGTASIKEDIMSNKTLRWIIIAIAVLIVVFFLSLIAGNPFL